MRGLCLDYEMIFQLCQLISTASSILYSPEPLIDILIEAVSKFQSEWFHVSAMTIVGLLKYHQWPIFIEEFVISSSIFNDTRMKQRRSSQSDFDMPLALFL